MRTIIIISILGLALGFLGCTQNQETTESDQEFLVEDGTENTQEEETKEEDGKHIDDPAEVLEDLIF
jgi:hypothetical protein